MRDNITLCQRENKLDRDFWNRRHSINTMREQLTLFYLVILGGLPTLRLGGPRFLLPSGGKCS